MTAAIATDDLSALLDEPRPNVDPRSVPVRLSRLKEMGRSPLHYFHAVQEDRDDSLAMRLGRGAHAMLLGMPVVRWTGKVRSGKVWEQFAAQNADSEILNNNEWATASGMAEAVRAHDLARDLLFAVGTELEQTIEWEIGGRKCTSRPDARRGHDVLVDLKSTRCSEPRKFSRDAQFMGYHAQFAFYGEAIRYETGHAPRENYVVAVESKAPYAVTVLRVTQRSIDEGQRLWRLWWERLMVCESANHWPAYTQTIEDFDVADDGELKLTIGGEEVEF